MLAFNAGTHPSRENVMRTVMRNVPNVFYNTMQYDRFLSILCHSKYGVCPRGNGIDTHRLWECLYLKVVPLVDRNCVNEYFEDLGLVIIDDWNMVTPAFLEENYETFYNRLKCPPTMSYYEDILKVITRTADFGANITISSSAAAAGAEGVAARLRKMFEETNPRFIVFGDGDCVVARINELDCNDNIMVSIGEEKIYQVAGFAVSVPKHWILSNKCIKLLYPFLDHMTHEWKYLCAGADIENNTGLCLLYYVSKTNPIVISGNVCV
jgi:hypothetical protein